MIIKYSDKITLRAIEENDLDVLKELINDPEIESMTGGFSFPVSSTQQLKWYSSLASSDSILRLAIDTADFGCIGTIILSDIDWKNRNAQVHIKTIESRWIDNTMGRVVIAGHGYGTDSIKAITKYAFEQLNLNLLFATILDYNTASQKAFSKAGYKMDGVLRQRVYKNNKYNDLQAWSITKDDFKC